MPIADIDPELLKRALKTPYIPALNFGKVMAAERATIELGLRIALSLWVSELEPVVMFRGHDPKPYGLTASGHNTPYVLINWPAEFDMSVGRAVPPRASLRANKNAAGATADGVL